MSIDRMSEIVRRLFFVGGVALLALAVAEKVANSLGQTMVLAWAPPSVLAQYATVAMVFAIAFVLASIRDELRRR
jgi:hypothetical protein